MPACECDTYGDLELRREVITKRIKETRDLKKRLDLLAKHPDREHRLYRCPTCGSQWQSARAWNWGAEEYLYRVPEIDPEAWMDEAYADPDELLIFTAMLQEYLERNDFTLTDEPCRSEGCPRRAIRLSVFCLPHHLEHSVAGLGYPPRGRLFGPYSHLSPENFHAHIARMHEQSA